MRRSIWPYFTLIQLFPQRRKFVKIHTEPSKEAERLFWLDNWVKARPLYAKCERDFRQRETFKSETPRSLQPPPRRLRKRFFLTLSFRVCWRQELKKPIVQTTPSLKLRCLIVKGTADLSINEPDQRWTGVDRGSRDCPKLGEKGWEERLKGELGIVRVSQRGTAKSVRAEPDGLRGGEELH